MDKNDLRKASLSKRDALSKEEIEEKSRMIFEKLMELEQYRDADNVLVYASMRSEVITDDIILDALANGKKVFCPKVTDKEAGVMEFVRIMTLEDLKEGYFGIREPEITQGAELVNSHETEMSLIIMPGVAFDKNRNRIGYGGGFYDRYLTGHDQINTVALAFDCQIIDGAIDSSTEDIRPGIILTENQVII